MGAVVLPVIPKSAAPAMAAKGHDVIGSWYSAEPTQAVQATANAKLIERLASPSPNSLLKNAS